MNWADTKEWMNEFITISQNYCYSVILYNVIVILHDAHTNIAEEYRGISRLRRYSIPVIVCVWSSCGQSNIICSLSDHLWWWLFIGLQLLILLLLLVPMWMACKFAATRDKLSVDVGIIQQLNCHSLAASICGDFFRFIRHLLIRHHSCNSSLCLSLPYIRHYDASHTQHKHIQ